MKLRIPSKQGIEPNVLTKKLVYLQYNRVAMRKKPIYDYSNRFEVIFNTFYLDFADIIGRGRKPFILHAPRVRVSRDSDKLFDTRIDHLLWTRGNVVQRYFRWRVTNPNIRRRPLKEKKKLNPFLRDSGRSCRYIFFVENTRYARMACDISLIPYRCN